MVELYKVEIDINQECSGGTIEVKIDINQVCSGGTIEGGDKCKSGM